MEHYPTTLGVLLALSLMTTLVSAAVCMLNAYNNKKPEVSWLALLAAPKTAFQSHPENFLTPAGVNWIKRFKLSLAAAFVTAALTAVTSIVARW